MRNSTLFDQAISITNKMILLKECPDEIVVGGRAYSYSGDRIDTLVGWAVSQDYIHESFGNPSHLEILASWLYNRFDIKNEEFVAYVGEFDEGMTDVESSFEEGSKEEAEFKDLMENSDVDDLYTDPDIILGRFFITPKVLTFWNGLLELQDPKVVKMIEHYIRMALTLEPEDITFQSGDQKNDEFITWADITGESNNEIKPTRSKEELDELRNQHLVDGLGKELRKDSVWSQVRDEKFKEKNPLQYNYGSRFSEAVDMCFPIITESPDYINVGGEVYGIDDAQHTFIGFTPSHNYIYATELDSIHHYLMSSWLYDEYGRINDKISNTDDRYDLEKLGWGVEYKSSFKPKSKEEKEFADYLSNPEINLQSPLTLMGRFYLEPEVFTFWNKFIELTNPDSIKTIEKFVRKEMHKDPSEIKYQSGDMMNTEFLTWEDLTSSKKISLSRSDEELDAIRQQHFDETKGKELRKDSYWRKAGDEKFKEKNPLQYNYGSRFSEAVESCIPIIEG